MHPVTLCDLLEAQVTLIEGSSGVVQYQIIFVVVQACSTSVDWDSQKFTHNWLSEQSLRQADKIMLSTMLLNALMTHNYLVSTTRPLS